MALKHYIIDFLYKTGIYKPLKKLYKAYRDPKVKENALEYVEEILQKVYMVFEEHTKDYWLDYGTLLGQVRSGELLPGDDDLDFGVLVENDKSLEPYMKKQGFVIAKRVITEGKVTFEQYKYKDFMFDIFYYSKDKNNHTISTMIWLPEHYEMPQRFAYINNQGNLSQTTFKSFDTKYIEFYGVKFKIPSNAGEYLSQHYGEDYMIPNPNFSLEDELNRKRVDKEYKVEFYHNGKLIELDKGLS